MFIGHIAVAFAAKRATPWTSLGTLILAATFLDLLWPIFLLLGWERVVIESNANPFLRLNLAHYPISHSLVTSLVWSALLGGLSFALRRDRRRAIIVGLLVFSHWILDFVTHRPDLPLWPGGTARVGLGLWNSVPSTLLVESAMFAGGVYLYTRATVPRDWVGHVSWWSLVGFLVLLYFGTLTGPPPPNERTLAIMASTGWLLPAWGYWIDRNRVVTSWDSMTRKFGASLLIASPEDLYHFASQVRVNLEAAGLDEAAGRFARIQGTAFTTGNEWLGELGDAVREIRRTCAVPTELDAELERIMIEVRRAWPTL